MVTEEQEQKITYTTMNLEQVQTFNTRFEQALDRVRHELGRTYPVYIANRERTTDNGTFQSISPNDTREVLGMFQDCGRAEADAAVAAAKAAFKPWSRMPWEKRVEVLRRAASIFRERKYDIGAWLCVEAGKARLEAMGEVEEAADLLDGYCDYMTDRGGFVMKLAQLNPKEVNYSVLKPYGAWVVIAPFNFPVALATGMLAGVLVTGNTAIFKPSHETPLTGIKVYECLRDAGLPEGAINIVTGYGNEIGEFLSGNPQVDGIAFTGSKAVGTRVYAEFSRERPRPCITEMGGKNPVIVTEHADLTQAIEGTARAAFGYSGQKCSAASRAYIHEAVYAEFMDGLVERTKQLSVGNPQLSDVFTGPVINKRAYERFGEASGRVARDGQVLIGGRHLIEGDLERGYYCAPTVASLPADHPYFYEELFVPLIVVAKVSSLEEALERANDSEYGLTAGIFTRDEGEIRQFQTEIEAGVTYVNRAAGATTGAWPKVQSFGGWKASGSPGKSALGPYYIEQFLQEQTQTIVHD